ncbi:MAG: branched-chain amino acid ABC transporter permease, partial [Deltaproteobacteria bacterium]|nr:branched-chain amino acid ABC transporter permease [Deltaproteobacteria bacterium]
TGQLSFGHASFYGLGAYGTGLLIVKLQWPLWAAMMGGVLTATLGGIIIGYLSFRRSDVYFSLLTMAFSQILYFLAFQFRGLTGGDDGLRGIPVFRPFSIDLGEPLNMYYFSFVFFLVLAYLARRLLRSPLGKAMLAVKENEDRAIACGFNTQRIKLVSFVISAIYGGLAGSLWCLHLRFVGVETFDFMLNGEVIFVCIVGGVGTYFGPIVGSAVFLLLHDYIQLIMERWELVVGLILIFFILFFNQGIVGAIENRVAAYREKKAAGVGSIQGEEST